MYESNTNSPTLVPHDLVFRVLGYDKHFINRDFEAAIFRTLSTLDTKKFSKYGTRRGTFFVSFIYNTYDKTMWKQSVSQHSVKL